MRRVIAVFVLGLAASCAPSKPAPAAKAIAAPPPLIERFAVSKPISLGEAPHGMWRYGDTLALALAGEDKIVLLDTRDNTVLTTIAVADTPLDVRPAPGGGFWVARFRAHSVVRINGKGEVLQTMETGKSPSLFSNGGRADRWSIVSEFADRLTVFDPQNGKVTGTVKTGKRPYPAALLHDGSLAFIPLRDENAVQVYDLKNDREVSRVSNCLQPEGGDLSAGEAWYLVACKDAVLWINTSNYKPDFRTTGTGPRPFAVLAGKDGRFAYVNNAGGDTVSVIDMKSRAVIGALKTGKQPIVMREFDGKIYVSSEISGTLHVITPPENQARSGRRE